MQGEAKEEVRSRLAIEDVVGEYVQLKRAGRNFKGLSPFSGEKTPSFIVSPDKNIWHDFSSNKGGDIFAFIMEVEGLDFRGALELLARKAGVELADYENQTSKDNARLRKRLIEANTLAARYYQQCLLRNQHAMNYVFKQRGLDRNAVTEFQIGYAPDSGNALIAALTKKGFSKKELTDAGLSNRFGGDLFRGRMMVPLMDSGGQVIGFTGRIIAEVAGAPKYLNTPQTLIYDKSRHVFGFSQAKDAIRQQGYVVMVEGNLDVVSSFQCGVEQTVATAGTAMTTQHLRTIKRLTGDVRLAYDGDKAGIAATERAITLASEVGLDLTIISLPDGNKDPDELIKKDPDLWRQAVATSVPAVDWIIDQYSRRVDMTTAIGKRTFTTASLAIVAKLSDAVEREHYERKIASMTATSLEAVQDKAAAVGHEPTALKPVKPTTDNSPQPDYSQQDDILALTAVDTHSRELLSHFNSERFVGEERQALFRYLANNTSQILEEVPDSLQKYQTYVKIIILRAEERYAEWDTNGRYFETARLLRKLEHEHKKQTKTKLTLELKSAEESGDETKANQLRQALYKLIKEIASGKR